MLRDTRLNFFFFSNLWYNVSEPNLTASLFLLQLNCCNPKGATPVNFAQAGLGSTGLSLWVIKI